MLDVYKSVYNLEGQPFRLGPDYRFSFGHQTYDDAKSYLKYAISEGEGIVAVTGAPGTGKTTLIASLISELNTEQVQVGVVTNVQLDSGNLLDMVIDALSLTLDRSDHISAMQGFKLYLRHQNEKGRRVILIVDEAQGLTPELLEELRLFSNFQHNTNLLLQIFLVGQEPLMDIIRSPGMEQLHQRLIAAAQLKPLTFEQTADYVMHRLNCVGWKNDPVLTDEALSLIHKFSAGVPRRINLICHRLFLHAGLKEKHELLGGDALQVIVELHREGLLTPVAMRALGEYVGGIKDMAAS
ncbi:MAG: AAA family ATPase [Gammaproteobacteria bacterium]|nr:AAA family ATPase [Gammaproteobacteria bacterium]